MRARNCGVASSLRIWPLITKKRGSRERSSPPCQTRILILPRCPEARGNIDLDRNTDFESSSNSRATPGAIARACAPSNGFRAAVYDQHRPHHWRSCPPIAVPVGSPTSEPSAQSRGGCAALGTATGHQPHSFGGVKMVGGPCRKVESSAE